MTKLDYEQLAAFRYELRRFLRFSEQAAREHGMASSQYLALLAIQGYPGKDQVTVGELAERLQLAPHTVVELADRLEQAGLAKRTNSEGDRRQVHVSLTDIGLERLDKLADLHQRELDAAGPQLIKVLNRILKTPQGVWGPTSHRTSSIMSITTQL